MRIQLEDTIEHSLSGLPVEHTMRPHGLEYHPWCVSCYLAVSAIRVAYRHKDLREELLGLLLCVLLLCHTSGCI